MMTVSEIVFVCQLDCDGHDGGVAAASGGDDGEHQ